MNPKKQTSRLMSLLQSSIEAFFRHPMILLPFMTVAFIQILFVEILYFAPRSPLSAFFAPIIRRIFGEAFLHYPYNFAVVFKMFQAIQIPLYIFVSSFFIAAAVAIIAAVNSGHKISFAKACGQALSRYIHIVLAAVISFGVFYGLSEVYGLVIKRALQIQSTQGPYFILKLIVLRGAPYVNLLIGAFVTTLFAFVIPLIMIEKKKIFGALIHNFRALKGSVVLVFSAVFLPTLLYVPVLIFRGTASPKMFVAFPEIKVWAIVISVLVMFIIDAMVYTALTTYYLLKKENS